MSVNDPIESRNALINGTSKIPQITLAFWVMKICATTLGETGGDLMSMTLNVGYTISSIILISIFLIALVTQLRSQKFRPVLYWTVILTTSTAGTTMSDFMDRTLRLGYARGSLLLVSLLMSVLLIWRLSEGSLSVDRIFTRKGELFYWIAILFSNTLGTALGDYLADSSGLALVVACHWSTKISPVLLFWIAFILTRPFGATFGDLLTKPPIKGGLGFGTIGSSAVLFGLLAILVGYSMKSKNEAVLEPTA
jgi:uncharacterized membrane-anchored protein